MVVDPRELGDFVNQRQNDLVAWRENERLASRLPRQESALSKASRQVVRAVISRLETFAAEPEQPGKATIRRGA